MKPLKNLIIVAYLHKIYSQKAKNDSAGRIPLAGEKFDYLFPEERPTM